VGSRRARRQCLTWPPSMAIWLPDSAVAPLPASQVTTSDTSSGSTRASRSGSVMFVGCNGIGDKLCR
jgi:hypothetical protein